MIDRLADAEILVDNCCQALGVSRQGYNRVLPNDERRHSSLCYRTPIQYELLSEQNPIPA